MRAIDWPQVTVRSLDINGDFVVRSLSTQDSREAFKMSYAEIMASGEVLVTGRIELSATYNGGEARELRKDYEVRDARVQGAFTFQVDTDREAVVSLCRSTIDRERQRVRDELSRAREQQRKAHFDALAQVDLLHKQASDARGNGAASLVKAGGFGIVGAGLVGFTTAASMVSIVSLLGGDAGMGIPDGNLDGGEFYIPMLGGLAAVGAGALAYLTFDVLVWPSWDAVDANFARAEQFDQQAASVTVPPLPPE